MAQPTRTPRPLPQPPESLIISAKTDHPSFKKEIILTARRTLKTLETTAPGFHRQNQLITQRITIIQYIEDQQVDRELPGIQKEFDEAFAYTFSANTHKKQSLETLFLQSHNFLNFLQQRQRPLDPVILRIQNICNLALEYKPPPPPAKPSLQRTSSSGSSGSPSTSRIARSLEGKSIPENPSEYEEWLTSLKQYPPSNNLQEDIVELDGTLAYCLVSTQTVDKRIQDLEKFSAAIVSEENPHRQRINRICQRAIELLKNPTPPPAFTAPEPDSKEHSEGPNRSSWNLPKIAAIIALTLGGIAALFMGYKRRTQILQKSLQLISRIKRTFSNKI